MNAWTASSEVIFVRNLGIYTDRGQDLYRKSRELWLEYRRVLLTRYARTLWHRTGFSTTELRRIQAVLDSELDRVLSELYEDQRLEAAIRAE